MSRSADTDQIMFLSVADIIGGKLIGTENEHLLGTAEQCLESMLTEHYRTHEIGQDFESQQHYQAWKERMKDPELRQRYLNKLERFKTEYGFYP